MVQLQWEGARELSHYCGDESSPVREGMLRDLNPSSVHLVVGLLVGYWVKWAASLCLLLFQLGLCLNMVG